MTKKLLITGGAGFIGSHLIKYLLKNYPTYQVVNLDLLTYAGNLANVEEIKDHPHYRFVQGDIADRELVTRLFAEEQFDTVINLAAESHVDRSINQPELFTHTNLVGATVLLEVAKQAWQTGVDNTGYPLYQPTARFIQISTDEVYGALGATGRFVEGDCLRPSSPYSASKAGADLMIGAYYKTFRLPAMITRSSNNYGSHQHVEKLIPRMVSRALANQPLPLYGGGRQVRDWLHVEDHCLAIDLVLHGGRIGEVYHIGADNERTNQAVVYQILEQLAKPTSLIVEGPDRLGHDWRYALDTTKIRTELGFKPQHRFEQGLAETVAWYCEQRV